ncbi:DUF4330 domain-containing protein [Proteiniborus sp. MB09-C3]|uniref:DUF4330 domain-containing protein n=1 Tax=Proteiniborus sp. MB09-C3 TaxID=3050072 RepID=UPI00255726EF|nr:DUF4330 domain-containing protein [Proteiniborus sp. MB09-C3]WIV13461.1 DUF4330 domain-containing protein [Proteiniborus sp. MB09-C3]
MKIIDDKGRLFSKVNILDLSIILMVLVLGLAGFYKLKTNNKATFIKPKPVDIKVIVRAREETSIDKIKVGDILKEYDTGIVLGEIKSIDIQPATLEVNTTDGQVKLAEIPERYDYYINIDANAIVNENAIVSGNKELRIGNKLVLRTKTYALESYILEIGQRE